MTLRVSTWCWTAQSQMDHASPAPDHCSGTVSATPSRQLARGPRPAGSCRASSLRCRGWAVRDINAGRYNHGTSLVLVTHGLALRVFLMRWFHWTVDQFLEVFNPPNAEVSKCSGGQGCSSLQQVICTALTGPVKAPLGYMYIPEQHSRSSMHSGCQGSVA